MRVDGHHDNGTARIPFLDWLGVILPSLNYQFSVKTRLEYLERTDIIQASLSALGQLSLRIWRIEGEPSLLPIDVKTHVGNSDID
jgi:hypothetical protein